MLIMTDNHCPNTTDSFKHRFFFQCLIFNNNDDVVKLRNNTVIYSVCLGLKNKINIEWKFEDPTKSHF